MVVEPRVSGFLVARHYKKGMPVRKGQLIFEIDDSEYYTALLSAQAALESSRALALEAKNNFSQTTGVSEPFAAGFSLQKNQKRIAFLSS